MPIREGSAQCSNPACDNFGRDFTVLVEVAADVRSAFMPCDGCDQIYPIELGRVITGRCQHCNAPLDDHTSNEGECPK